MKASMKRGFVSSSATVSAGTCCSPGSSQSCDSRASASDCRQRVARHRAECTADRRRGRGGRGCRRCDRRLQAQLQRRRGVELRLQGPALRRQQLRQHEHWADEDRQRRRIRELQMAPRRGAKRRAHRRCPRGGGCGGCGGRRRVGRVFRQVGRVRRAHRTIVALDAQARRQTPSSMPCAGDPLANCSNTGSAPIWNAGRRGAAATAASVMLANSSAEFGAVMRSDTSSMLTKLRAGGSVNTINVGWAKADEHLAGQRRARRGLRRPSA